MKNMIFKLNIFVYLALFILTGCKSPGNDSDSSDQDNDTSPSNPSGPAASDIVNIPDANFLKFIINDVGADTDGDSQINYGEAWAVTEMIGTSTPVNITDLTGLEAFTNLTVLKFPYGGNDSYKFTSIPLASLTSLQTFLLRQSHVTSLDFGDNPHLNSITLSAPRVQTADLSKAPNVITLEASDSVNIALATIYIPAGFTPPAGWSVKQGVQLVEK